MCHILMEHQLWISTSKEVLIQAVSNSKEGVFQNRIKLEFYIIPPIYDLDTRWIWLHRASSYL